MIKLAKLTILVHGKQWINRISIKSIIKIVKPQKKTKQIKRNHLLLSMGQI